MTPVGDFSVTNISRKKLLEYGRISMTNCQKESRLRNRHRILLRKDEKFVYLIYNGAIHHGRLTTRRIDGCTFCAVSTPLDGIKQFVDGQVEDLRETGPECVIVLLKDGDV